METIGFFTYGKNLIGEKEKDNRRQINAIGDNIYMVSSRAQKSYPFLNFSNGRSIYPIILSPIVLISSIH